MISVYQLLFSHIQVTLTPWNKSSQWNPYNSFSALIKLVAIKLLICIPMDLNSVLAWSFSIPYYFASCCFYHPPPLVRGLNLPPPPCLNADTHSRTNLPLKHSNLITVVSHCDLGTSLKHRFSQTTHKTGIFSTSFESQHTIQLPKRSTSPADCFVFHQLYSPQCVIYTEKPFPNTDHCTEVCN